MLELNNLQTFSAVCIVHTVCVWMRFYVCMKELHTYIFRARERHNPTAKIQNIHKVAAFHIFLFTSACDLVNRTIWNAWIVKRIQTSHKLEFKWCARVSIFPNITFKTSVWWFYQNCGPPIKCIPLQSQLNSIRMLN